MANIVKIALNNTEYEIGSKSGSGHDIGELIQSTLPLTDAGLHLLDGAKFLRNGIYNDFINYIENLYNRYSNDFFINDTTYDVTFEQPVLTQNGIIGMDGFNVQASSEYSSYTAWKAFAGTSDYWLATKTALPITYEFSNTKPLKITQLSFKTRNAGECPTAGNVYASYDYENWVLLKEFTNDVTTAGSTWSIDLSDNDDYYCFYKIEATTMSTGTYWGTQIILTATYQNSKTAEELYNEYITNYGVCGKFLYVNKTYYQWGDENSSEFYNLYTTTTEDGENVIIYRKENDIFVVDNSFSRCWIENGELIVFFTPGSGALGGRIYQTVNANYLRLPKIEGFTEGTLTTTSLGNLVEAGLPNITGNSRWQGVSPTGEASGAFSRNSTSGGETYGGSGNTNRVYFNFDASKSNIIYGNSDTVQPQAIKVLYYIAVATTTKTDIEVDIDEIATDLNGKADVDLNNVSIISSFSSTLNTAGIRTVVESYQNGTDWYRIWSDGWCEQGGVYTVTSASPHTILLLKKMSNTNYNISAIPGMASSGDSTVGIHIRTDQITTSSFSIQKHWNSNSGFYYWSVQGFAS